MTDFLVIVLIISPLVFTYFFLLAISNYFDEINKP